MTAPARPGRIVALDYLRGFIIALVVLHHSVLAYCNYGHFDTHHYLWSSAPIVDHDRWLGFDVLVLFNDSYFMPLMFLLSGLFVWPSLLRKGDGDYLRDRLLRLGVPFAVAAVTVVPLAYYPSFRMTGAEITFGSFWANTVFSGPWPSGPLWFIAVLLALDFIAVVVHRFGLRRETGIVAGISVQPALCFGLLVAISAIAYLPLLAVFGASSWFAFGPFAVQASRFLLYSVYFFVGVVLGRGGPGRGLLLPEGQLTGRWARWVLLAVLLFVWLLAVAVLRLTHASALHPLKWLLLYGGNVVLFCAAAVFALLGVFLRFVKRQMAGWGSLSANAYGIYIVHYPVVTWAQYAMLEVHLTALLKATLVFAVALLSSWCGVSILRRLPGVARIL